MAQFLGLFCAGIAGGLIGGDWPSVLVAQIVWLAVGFLAVVIVDWWIPLPFDRNKPY